MNTTQDENIVETITQTVLDMALRPQGVNTKAVIEVIAPMFPDIEFRADRENDLVLWRDKIDATIIPFAKGRHKETDY